MNFCESLESRTLFAAATYLDSTTVDGEGRTLSATLRVKYSELTVTRTNADGTLDTTFGTNGTAFLREVRAAIGNNFKVIADHGDRPLVLAGTTLVRLKENGARDKTFDGDGRLTVPVVYQAADVDVDARNRPVIAGTSAGKTGDRGTILRLGERGVLDKSFGTGGAYKRPVPMDKKLQRPGDSTALGVKVLADGKIIGAGSFDYEKFYLHQDRLNINYRGVGIYAWRLDATGALDPTYGKGGAAGFTNVYDAGGSAVRESIGAITDDGGVYAATFDSPALEGGFTYYTYIDPDGVVGTERLKDLPA